MLIGVLELVHNRKLEISKLSKAKRHILHHEVWHLQVGRQTDYINSLEDVIGISITPKQTESVLEKKVL